MFVDDILVTTDYDYSNVKGDCTIRLVVIQAKRSSGFKEQALHSLISTINDLLNLDNPLENFDAVYNSQLLAAMRDFRQAANELAERFPKFKFSFYYVTKGDSKQVHPNVKNRVDTLKEKIQEFFSEFEFSYEFLGARDLLNLARRQSIKSLQLKTVEAFTAEGEGIVCLVRLKDYFEFISDEEMRRRQIIFDANVREYEGSVEVNKGIRDTLVDSDTSINFWWLNNGITIVATKAPLTGKTLTLENPKVVNGLQTSQEIYKYFIDTTREDDKRVILVRIITTDDEEIRNKVIKATNSQTRIPPFALRTTEPIHHDIENYFLHNDLYYDRQKNYYKNIGKPRNKIITVKYLSQAIGAILLQEPNNSRGRPTNLIKSDDKYAQLFSENYDIKLYLICALLMRAVDEFLRDHAPDNLKKEKTNLRFQLAMFAASIMIGEFPITPQKTIEKINIDDLDEKILLKHASYIWKIYDTLKSETGFDGDRIAKSKDFDDRIIDHLRKIYSGVEEF